MKTVPYSKHWQLLFFLAITLNVSFSTAQTSPSIDILHSAYFATGNEISKVYGAGPSIAIQGNLPLFKRRISIQPILIYNYFGNYYSKSVRDNLNIFNYGVNLAYNFKLNEKLVLSPALGIYQSTGIDYISPRLGYTGSSVNLLSFKGVAYNLGIQMIYSKLFIQTGYIISRVNTKLSSELTNDINSQYTKGSIYNTVYLEKTKMSMDRFYITIGFRIVLKK